MATFTCLSKFKLQNKKKCHWTEDKMQGCSLPFIYKDKRFVCKYFPPPGRATALSSLRHSECGEQTLLHQPLSLRVWGSRLYSISLHHPKSVGSRLYSVSHCSSISLPTAHCLWKHDCCLLSCHFSETHWSLLKTFMNRQVLLLPSHVPGTVSRTLSHLYEVFFFFPSCGEEEGLILAHSLIVVKSWQHPKKWMPFLSVAVGK